mmetsp:Transcript_21199/g.54325  ORF Transcript_21199/g.54325 Transcript_21199/m.54325 type:complete len:206 (+) Transcript_21199:132-749(+)
MRQGCRNPERYKNFQNAGFCRMWRGFEPALAMYYNAAVKEWARRGHRNIECVLEEVDAGQVQMPAWLGEEKLHACHRAALLCKDPQHYGRFGWSEQPSVEYLWPEKQADGTWALVPPKNGRSQPKSAAPSRPHWRSGKRRADFGERPPVKRQKQREAQAALKTYSRTVKRKVPGTGAAAKAEPGGQRITRSMASQEPPRGGLPKS